MNLVEFEAKRLLRAAGLPVPQGSVLRADETAVFDGACVLKAQIPVGGRGKLGLVLPAGATDGPAQLAMLRLRMREQGYADPVVLIERSINWQRECYLAWGVDDVEQSYALYFSPRGGIEVESYGGALEMLHFEPSHVPAAHDFVAFFLRAGFTGRAVGALCRFACASWRVFVQNDAQLVEINPLAVLESGDVMALDAKIVLDDNARPRHGEWAGLYSAELADGDATDLERRAARLGFTFVELEGTVAVLAGGAGVGMAILDVLADAGTPAANFADASGGSGESMFEELGRITFERATRPEVTAILMYFTLAATSVASVVKGVMKLLDSAQPPKPLVIGLLCSGAGEREMTFAQAQAAFAARGLRCVAGLDEVMEALQQTLKPFDLEGEIS